MESSYDVRVRKTYVYQGSRTTTYWVRWSVSGNTFKEPFKTSALADSFRSNLVTAASRGEAFSTEDGLPLSSRRAQKALSWYEFSVTYVDMKWPDAAGSSRRSIAEALTTATFALLDERGQPDHKTLRLALRRWAYNTSRRDSDKPRAVADALRWVERHTKPVSTLTDPAVTHAMLQEIGNQLNGTRASANTFNRKRGVLYNAFEYAVLLGLLDANPLHAKELKMAAAKKRARSTVDRRCVANPEQARRLLSAVSDIEPNGARLTGFFGLMYYSALRPEEAVNLGEQNLMLPTSGWGDLLLEEATPDAGADWTDSGETRDRRRLKHRAEDDPRKVPCPPELTELLHAHIKTFGTSVDGKLFRGVRSKRPLDSSTYERIWAKARARALTPQQVASPLAKRPYDLRHAAVSTWLNAGVAPQQVAEWAGHSVEVLLRVYAKCLDGTEHEARKRVDAALRRARTGQRRGRRR